MPKRPSRGAAMVLAASSSAGAMGKGPSGASGEEGLWRAPKRRPPVIEGGAFEPPGGPSLTQQRRAMEREARQMREDAEEARKAQKRRDVWDRKDEQAAWRPDAHHVDHYFGPPRHTAKPLAAGLAPRKALHAVAQAPRPSPPAAAATAATTFGNHDKRGIANLGNTCYMGAVLQALRGAPSFARRLDALLRAHVDKHSGGAPASLGAVRTCVELRRCLAAADSQSLPALLTAVGKRVGAAHAGAFTGSHLRRQQDAHEFLVALLDAVGIEACSATAAAAEGKENISPSLKLADATPPDPVQATFGATLERHLRCASCGVARPGAVAEPANILSLTLTPELRRQTGLNAAPFRLTDLLRRGLLGEEEVELTCPACGGKSAKSRFFVRRFPETLVVHLKRFEAYADAGGGNAHMRKVCDAVDFPETLDLGFADAHVAASAWRENDDEAVGVARRKPYRLASVVMHHGETLHCGHYTAYVRESSGAFRHCNDSRTRPADAREVYGLASQSRAYLLAYVASPPPPL